MPPMGDTQRPIIRGTSVFLRGWEHADATIYARWRSDAAPMRTSGFGFRAGLTEAGAEATIATAIENQGKPDWRFALCTLDGERPIGEVFLKSIDHGNRTAEFGIFIGDPADWGKGYGTDALNAVCDFGFGRLDLARIYLLTRADNAGGLRSYAKAGFQVEGTMRSAVFSEGRRHDIVVMGLLRDEWEALPRPKSWELDPRP